MVDLDLPSKDDVVGFGSDHNPAVWSKHRALLSDPSDLDAVLQRCQSPTGRLARSQVFEMADAKLELGVIAAIVWGFPRGSMPGGKWRGFAQAFGSSTRFAEAIADCRSREMNGTSAVLILNNVVNGLGFATTTKMAYFARLTFREGPALIYDANVIKAITAPTSPWGQFFPKTKAQLGSAGIHAKGAPTYSSYIEEASTLASQRRTTPDVIEVAMFRYAAKPGRWA